MYKDQGSVCITKLWYVERKENVRNLTNGGMVAWVMWALRRGRGTSRVTHGRGLTSLGVKAGPGPGVNVSDSERMACYVTLYVV